MDRVNERLDYLVIGSIPAGGWKPGDYGRKIEEARTLRSKGRGPVLVPESLFMNALAATPTDTSEIIDEKVFVGTFKFCLADADVFDEGGFTEALTDLQQDGGLHITVRSHRALIGQDLFREDLREDSAFLVVETRMVRRMALDDPISPLVEDIERRLEDVEGVDGELAWFARRAGSADIVRLLREIPQQLKVKRGHRH